MDKGLTVPKCVKLFQSIVTPIPRSNLTYKQIRMYTFYANESTFTIFPWYTGKVRLPNVYAYVFDYVCR